MSQQHPQIFHFVMIKPSHYDDDGYPIQWLRSLIPSNTLAAVNGLVEDCAGRQVLGPEVEIRATVLDETNTRIRPERIMRAIKQAGGRGLIAFVGVQTNQFPRALDLAQPFLAAGLPVALGGFHVSGCLAMLPELPPEISAAQEMGISLFAGEAEDGRLDEIIRDAASGNLKPLYNHMDNLPALDQQPLPFLTRKIIGRVQNDIASFDLGRGCPYQCSFCTIINVQGRKSRFRTADDLEAIVRKNASQGIHKFFITDDDLARNRNWEELFDRLIWLRQNQGLPVSLTIQVDTLCHRIAGFIDKACAAGVERTFIGLENINPDNLLAANKRQNKITEYRDMLQQWQSHGITILAGYILGFPNDTRESILADIEIIKNELSIDILEFFFLTPLPGSQDHKELLAAGVWMDPDLNKYDLAHRVTHHARMSDEEWDSVYKEAWYAFYTPEHIERVGRRAASRAKHGVNVDEVTEFFMAYKIDHIHPLESGVLRRKFRCDRRPGLPLVSPLIFYPAYAVETAVKLFRYGWGYFQAARLHRRIHKGSGMHSYSDTAIAPCSDSDFQELALFQNTTGGLAAVKRKLVIDGQAAVAPVTAAVK